MREESWTGRRGAHLTLRAAQADDGMAVGELVARLSKESRYFRFLTGGPVAPQTIDGLVAPGSGGVALVITAPREGGTGSTVVANGQYVVTDGKTAEFAVMVSDAWQGQGLGRRLIGKLLQLARAAGLATVRGDVLSENRRMLAILRDCGFTCRRNPEDSFLHEATLALAGAGARVGSLAVEGIGAR